MKEKRPLRVGLIGCGDISSLHLKTYASCGIEVAALCDLIPERAERRRAEFKLGEVPIFTDYRKLLKQADIDFITNATPVAEHAPITIAGLQAGKHVACEKPSTLSIKQNKAVISAAAKARKKVIFFSSRFRWGDAVLAREFINHGDVGESYRVHVQYFWRRGRPGVDIIPTARWFANRKLAGGGNEHIYNAFVQAIRGEKVDIGTTPTQALAINELTQMALQSAAEQREVRRKDLVEA